MLRVTTVWSNFIGGPGYTNLYFGAGVDGAVHTAAEAKTVADRVRKFWLDVSGPLPSGVRLDVQTAVAEIDPQTGELEEEFQITLAAGQVSGASTEVYSGTSGACINWRTGTIVAGKKLRGKTFLVPLGGNAYQTDGTLSNATLGTLNAAAAALAGPAIGLGEALVVWHRPIAKVGGAVGRVLSHSIQDRAAVLTSRRQ